MGRQSETKRESEMCVHMYVVSAGRQFQLICQVNFMSFVLETFSTLDKILLIFCASAQKGYKTLTKGYVKYMYVHVCI